MRNLSLDRYYRGLVPEFMRGKVRDVIADSNWMNATLRRKLAHTPLGRDGSSWASLYFDNFMCAFSEREQQDLLADDLKAELGPGAAYRNSLHYWNTSSGELLQRMLYTDIKTYLVELLMKQDNMSMAASIESRVPFLDHELVEFAFNIPQRLQLGALSGKRILKQAVQDLLPQSILYRTKLGFPTPWSGWLAGPQLKTIRDLLLEPRSTSRNLFKPSAIARLFDQHAAGQIDHYDRIWRLLNLELWHRICLEGDEHKSVTCAISDVEPALKR